ncbi:MAG TPA: MFS transporter [Opitutaceae bacterium]|nr:MFS transporter [Opitutaceae bacterium]
MPVNPAPATPAASSASAATRGAGRVRWRIAFLVCAAITFSYLDRLTLPWTLSEIQKEYPFSAQTKALFDSAFLISYGLMYVGGGQLLDRWGTRRGFLAVMLFWSFACASQGLAGNYGMPAVFGMAFALAMLVASRFLLGAGEGGGFPAATRVVTEWFPVNERATAMGLINAGTAIGAVAAPWLILVVLNHTGWFGVAPWRWVFLITGALGLIWSIWWARDYEVPEKHAHVGDAERALILEGHAASSSQNSSGSSGSIPIARLLAHRETWAVIGAKFLTDAAWYFYMFWLPKFLQETFDLKFSAASSVGWIPYAASGVGCLVGGGLSSWLLRRGASVNRARKIALGLSAAFMPWVMFVPGLHSLAAVIFIFSLAFFGQQSWSTLVMILPTDLIPRRAVGTVAGFVGLGGALGGIVLGQIAGWLRDHGFSYTPILVTAGSLHVVAFVLICVVIPRIRALDFSPPAPNFSA